MRRRWWLLGKTLHTWKRFTRAYLAAWWRAAMPLLLAALARRRLQYRYVLDPEYFLDSPR